MCNLHMHLACAIRRKPDWDSKAQSLVAATCELMALNAFGDHVMKLLRPVRSLWVIWQWWITAFNKSEKKLKYDCDVWTSK